MTKGITAEADFSAFRISVVGGDEREQEIARLAVKSGAQVRAFGFPWPDAGIDGVELVRSAEDAFRNANIVLMPIPLPQPDGRLFATESIVPRKALLSLMSKNSHIITGVSDEGMRAAARSLGIGIHEYEHDQELMLLRGPAIVEGALKVVIENTQITIHSASIGIVGHGNIGSLLARTLIALAARVTVAARNPVQRATAYAAGAATIELEELPQAAADFDMLLSTVPAPVVTAKVIDRLPPKALVMDLSAPPGGVDLDYARQSGRAAVWARALGRRAPVTVGASQWSGIHKIIKGIIGIDAA